MKKFWAVMVVSLLAAALGPALAAQEKAKPEEGKAPAMSAEAKAAMEAYEKAGQVTENHKFLSAFVGTWEVEVKSWMGPGEPMISKGTAEIVSMYGGRYIKQEFKGLFMDKPFEGMGISGYDNVLKAYSSIWLDSMSTSIMTGTGTLDASGKVLTTVNTYSDPVSGKAKTSRDIITLVDANTIVDQMLEPGPGGKEVKTMELTYTRKGAPKK